MFSTTAQRVKKHREALRAAGLRPVQLWLPDTRQPAFVAECKRQSRRIVESSGEADVQRWLEQVADTDGWR